MRNFKFDAHGNMTVVVIESQVIEGVSIENQTHYFIMHDQLAAHMPMFEADMTPDQLAQAQAIIAAQAGE